LAGCSIENASSSSSSAAVGSDKWLAALAAEADSGELRTADFTAGKTLGVGTFGRVRFVVLKKTGKAYALKTLKKADLIKNNQVDHVMSETEVLQKLKHPFIVDLFGWLHDRRYVYLVLEYIVGGEFYTRLRNAGRLENEMSVFYSAQVTLIFEYVHSFNIVHRGLMPENILINVDGYLKLADFGLAKVLEDRTYTLCGTPEYIAPEVLLNKGHGLAVDWWTLGILIYEMIVGYPPFLDEDPMGIYQKVLSGIVAFPLHFNKDAKALVKKLVQADLGKRIGNLKHGAKDVKQHRWFKAIAWDDLFDKALNADYKPVVKGEHDTSHFDEYPDSEEDQIQAVKDNEDPFSSW